jgi:HSP20 family protein
MTLFQWRRPVVSTLPGFGRWSELRDEIDRLFEFPLSELARASRRLSGWTPSLDMHEDKDHVTVKAELPGMKREDIDISVQDGNLSISGERKSEKEFESAEVYRAERFVGRFQRTVALPAQVTADKATAQYKEGILTITLPKVEEAKPKQINIQAG